MSGTRAPETALLSPLDAWRLREEAAACSKRVSERDGERERDGTILTALPGRGTLRAERCHAAPRRPPLYLDLMGPFGGPCTVPHCCEYRGLVGFALCPR